MLVTDIEIIRRGQPARGTPIYIGRPSMLGNPYTHQRQAMEGTIRVATRGLAIESYGDWLRSLDADSPQWCELRRIAALPGPLSLICWCAPLPCHGQIIVDAVRELRRAAEITK